MSKIVKLLFLVALVFSFWGCKEEKAESNVIKIGVFEPLTGANAAGGELEVEGIKMANEMYPEVLGKKIELVIVDNKSDKVEAANAAVRLTDKEKVSAILGSWGSSFSMAAGPIVAKAKVPAIGVSCTNPLVTRGNDYYFRVCFIDPFQGSVMANYAYSNLNARKVAIVREISNDYSVALAKFFTDDFIKLTGDNDAIVTVLDYNTGDQDFTSQLTSLKGKKIDAIFAPGNYTESALVMKQLKEIGLDIPMLGGDTWETPELIEIAGSAGEGAVLSTFFTSETPITKTSEIFLKAYREKYSKEPAAVTALGFDAYLLVFETIKKIGTADPQKLRDALAKTEGFEGAAGIVTLDVNGDAVKPAIIKQIKDGKFTYLTTVEAR